MTSVLGCVVSGAVLGRIAMVMLIKLRKCIIRSCDHCMGVLMV